MANSVKSYRACQLGILLTLFNLKGKKMATVLIVDDRHINREFVTSILEYLDHHAVQAQDGKQGLLLLEQHHPDLIITDILMPVMDGYEFVRELKKDERFNNIPIIFYTATYRREEANFLAEDLGVQFVISKPSEPQLMIEVIQKALRISGSDLPIMAQTKPAKDFSSSLYSAPQHLIELEEKIGQTLKLIHTIKDKFRTGQEQTLLTENGMLVDLVSKIEQDLQSYQKNNKQLFSILELTLELIAEKDIEKLLQLFCHGARKAVDAEFAVAGIIDKKNQLRYFATSGNFNSQVSFESSSFNSSNFIKEILNHQSAYICYDPVLRNSVPFTLNEAQTALCCPIITPSEVYGFTYFINKKGQAQFNVEDVRILDTLTSEISIFYENKELYELIQHQAAKLQIESAKLKEAKENLSKSELMFRQFAENMKDVFWRTTSSLDKVIYISPGYETIWGKSTDSIYQDPCSWQDEILEEDKPKVKAFIKQIMQTQEDGPIEYRIMRKDGTIRNIYNKTICLKDKEGQLNHIIGIASDITEFLQNQKGLLLEEELGRILESGDAFITVAPEILKLICRIFDWEIGEFWLVDESEDYIQNVGIWHKNKTKHSSFKEASLNLKLKLGEDLPGRVWSAQQPLWIHNYPDTIQNKRTFALKEAGLRDIIGFPLLYQDNVLGVMCFINNNISPINTDFNRILTMVGTRLGDFISQKATHQQLLQLAKRGGYRAIF